MNKILAAVIGMIVVMVIGFAAKPYFSKKENAINNKVLEVKSGNVKLEWEELTDAAAWEARDSHAFFVFNDKMWIVGGLDGNGLVNENHQIRYDRAPHFNDVWNSEDGINWTKVSVEKIWPPRRSMSIIPYRGKLFSYGGWSPVSGYFNRIWTSDDGIKWTMVNAKVPWDAREGQAVEEFNGRLWLIGGVNYDKRKVFNDVWVSDDGISWTEATSNAGWSGRWDHAVAVFKGKLYLAAGMDLSSHTFRDVWSSQDGANWTEDVDVAPWPERQGHTLLEFKGKLIIMGRLNDESGINDAWYSDDGINWKSFGELPWDGREDFAGFIYKDKIYVAGGMARDWTWRHDVWVADLKTE